VAAVVDDVVIGLEDAVGEPVVAHELPNVLHHVEFRALWRQRQQSDVGRHGHVAGHVPSGLIEQEHGMAAWSDRGGDLGQMQVHRLGVAVWQDQGRTFALTRTDGAEEVG